MRGCFQRVFGGLRLPAGGQWKLRVLACVWDSPRELRSCPPLGGNTIFLHPLRDRLPGLAQLLEHLERLWVIHLLHQTSEHKVPTNEPEQVPLRLNGPWLEARTS